MKTDSVNFDDTSFQMKTDILHFDDSTFTTQKRQQNYHLATFKSIDYKFYSTVTDLAKFRGWSTLQPLITAI